MSEGEERQRWVEGREQKKERETEVDGRERGKEEEGDRGGWKGERKERNINLLEYNITTLCTCPNL